MAFALGGEVLGVSRSDHQRLFGAYDHLCSSLLRPQGEKCILVLLRTGKIGQDRFQGMLGLCFCVVLLLYFEAVIDMMSLFYELKHTCTYT